MEIWEPEVRIWYNEWGSMSKRLSLTLTCAFTNFFFFQYCVLYVIENGNSKAKVKGKKEVHVHKFIRIIVDMS